MKRRLPYKFTTVGIRQDQTHIGWQNFGREVWRNCKKQRIAIVSVFRPLEIGAEIGSARLDLNDPDFTVAPERHYVRPATAAECDFAQTFEIECSQEALRSPQNRSCAFIIADLVCDRKSSERNR
jgi:hypothetical protein